MGDGALVPGPAALYVVDAAERAALRELAACAGPLLLAARRPLGLPGEHLLELAPLHVPAEGADAADVRRSPAVRCFLELARATAPDVAADPPLDDVAALCRAVDGLPEALRLLAARLRVLGVAELREHVARGDALAPGGVLAPLAAAYAETLATLSPEERAALGRLAACPGAISAAFAERLVGGEAPLDVLGSLRDAALVRRHDERLAVLPLLRPLVAVPLSDVADALAATARHLVERFVRTTEPRTLALLLREQDTLQAAFDALVSPAGACVAGHEDTAWALCGTLLWLHWRYRGGTEAARRRLLGFTDAPGRLVAASPTALVELARTLFDMGDVPRLQRVVAVLGADGALSTDDGRALHGARWAEAALLLLQGDSRGALGLAVQAAAGAQADGTSWWEARLQALALKAAIDVGAWQEARAAGEASLRSAEAADSDAMRCLVLPNLVFVCARLGERSEALRHGERAVRLATQLHDLRSVAVTSANLAIAALDWGDLDHAEALLRRALALHEELGLPDFAALTQVMLARTLALAGREDAVEAELQAAERRLEGGAFAADRAVVALRAAGVRADLAQRRRDLHAALRGLQAAAEAHPEAGEELLVPLARVAALALLIGDAPLAQAALARGEPLYAACPQPQLTAAWDVYAALGLEGEAWSSQVRALAGRATVPLAGEPPREGGAPAFHNALVVRQALGFVWPHLTAEQRAEVEACARDPFGDALVLSADGERFRPPRPGRGEPEPGWVELSRRPALARLLHVLGDARLASPPQPLTEEALVPLLWPEERVLPAAASNRVQNALSLLRRAGLKELVALTPCGYLLRPDAPVIRLGAGPDALSGA